jgi:hypothetical protein
MRKALSVLALASAIALPSIASADEIAKEANASAVLSALDAVTTRANLSGPRGGIEYNPVARPFVRSNIGTAVYFATCAASVNVFARILHRTSPGLSRGYLAANAAFEASLVAGNMRRRQ